MPTSTARTFEILVFPKENNGFSIIRLSKLTSIFDAIWMPTCFHFAFQNRPKSFRNLIPRGIQKLIDFCFDFWCIWVPFWEPSWSHVAHQDAPKTLPRRAQDGSKIPRGLQEAPRLSQGASKMPPRSPKKLPRGFQGWFWMVFSLFFEMIFISFLVDFSWIVGNIFPLQSF